MVVDVPEIGPSKMDMTVTLKRWSEIIRAGVRLLLISEPSPDEKQSVLRE